MYRYLSSMILKVCRRIFLGRRSPRPFAYVLKLDLPELHDAVRLMGSLSNNVNQIARRLNEQGSIFETEIDDIANRQEELRTILSSILRRLDQIQH